MSESQEVRYYQFVKALGAIEQRMAFYDERADEIFDREGDGSVAGVFYRDKAMGLREALNLLQGE